jgi:hypothetical protein
MITFLPSLPLTPVRHRNKLIDQKAIDPIHASKLATFDSEKRVTYIEEMQKKNPSWKPGKLGFQSLRLLTNREEHGSESESDYINYSNIPLPHDILFL